MTLDSLAALVPSLAGRKILVVGDVILDEYVFGWATRMSREAPIPVLEFERQDHIPGGAANPAINVAALDSQAIQVGVIGQDTDGEKLCEILQARGVNPAGLIVDPARPTTKKTRIMAQMGLRFPQQVARIDRLYRQSVDGDVEGRVVEAISHLAGAVEAIMISDYLTGLVTPSVIAAVRTAADRYDILTTADAQGELDKYATFDFVKCNAEEASRYAGKRIVNEADFAIAADSLLKRLNLRRGLLITRGSEGITLAEPGREAVHIPAIHVEDVYDTVGAGDTVLAVMTLALTAGIANAEAAALANLAAGIVVRKVGNYAPTPADLLAAIHESI